MNTNRKSMLASVVGSALLMLTAAGAEANVVSPCTAGGGQNIVPVTNAGVAYCVSDSGWSDTWFMNPNQPSYVGALDLLSGDDAPFLKYREQAAGDTGWLTNVLDGGTLGPNYNTGAGVGNFWTVTSPVAYQPGHTDIAQSVLMHMNDGLQVTIVTHAHADGHVSQDIEVLNTSNNIYHDFIIGDYLNFHPNGSSAGANNLGTVSYANGVLSFAGDRSQASFLADAYMFLTINGQKVMPTYWDLGCSDGTTPGCVIKNIENGVFNMQMGPIGPGDNAGALAIAMGDLNPHDSFHIDIDKYRVPEPATLLLLGAGMIGLGFGRRKNA